MDELAVATERLVPAPGPGVCSSSGPERQAPLAFLPILTKARELDARLLLAGVLARNGYRVVLGAEALINAVASRVEGGLYVAPLLLPRLADLFEMLRRSGQVIIACLEEGLVYPDPAWYFQNRVSLRTANATNAIAAWGRASAADLASALPGLRTPILPLGNPRIDVVRPPCRAIHETAVRRVRARYPRYVLVNTNFDLVNHADGPGTIRGLRKAGLMTGPNDEERFARWAAFRQAMFGAFLAGIPFLQSRLADMHIVIRPHPSENPAPWQKLARGHRRVSVELPTDPVVPWILGAEALIHNSCTTAVEAFMLNTPAVAYQPAEAEGTMASPLPNMLSRPAHSWGQVADLVIGLDRSGRAGWVTADQERIADEFIAGRTGDLACERIVSLANELGAGKRPGTLPGLRLLEPWTLRLRRGCKEILRPVAASVGLASIDFRRRFDGLHPDDVAGRLASIGPIVGHDLHFHPYGPNACVVESAT